MMRISRGILSLVILPVLLISSVLPAQAQQGQTPRPITLKDALALALQQNLQVRFAAFEVAIARAQLEQAKAGKAVQVTGSASYTRINERAPTTISVTSGGMSITVQLPPPPVDTGELRVSLQYPLFTGGRLEAQIALAEANVKGAEATLQRTVQQVLFQVKQAYYQLLLARASRRAAERILAQAEENLRVARVRVQAGVAPQFDVLQAEVNLANARQGVVRALNSMVLARQALAALLNIPLDTLLEPQDELGITPFSVPLEELINRALRQRPELAELSARRAAAEAALELARSGARPNLALQGAYFLSGTSLQNLTSNWQVILALTLNLFDGGLTKARIQEAEERLRQLQVAESQQRQAIELEVRQSYLTLQSAVAELEASGKAVEQALEALRIANVRYQAGVSAQLEVIAAQAALAQAEVNRVQALFNYNLALAQLERAVGGF
ncbi:MAG: TolC family protein [Armatimonadota bacterium]|nr:TolC family protein [Armatimonadota bacterium]MDR5703153.1 TolC family protein [Armatimonadota bacterium]